MLRIKLFSTESEAFESSNFQLGIHLFEYIANCFLSVHDVLLVEQANLFQELAKATFSDVLNHSLREVSSFLSRYCSDDFFCFSNFLSCDPALSHVALHVVF